MFPVEVAVGVVAPIETTERRWYRVADAYLTRVLLPSRSNGTWQNYRYHVRAFLAAHPDPTSVTPAEVQIWAYRPTRFGRPPGASLIRARLSVVCGFYRYCQRAGLVERNPADLDANPRPRRKRMAVKAVTVADLRTLLLTLPATPVGRKLRALVVTVALTGLRRAEVLGLKRHSVEQADGRWYWVVRVKGGDVERGELPLPAVEAIRAMLAGEGRPFEDMRPTDRLWCWTPWAAWDALRRHSWRAGLTLTPHDLRRAYAQLLEAVGAPRQEIQQRLRHATLATTEQYYLPYTERTNNPRWPEMAERLLGGNK